MTPTGWELTVAFPFRLRGLANMHVGWQQQCLVVKETRLVVGLELLAQAQVFRREWRVMAPNPLLCLRVTQERTGPKVLDDDNLTNSFKAVRDEVAAFFNIDDGNRARWIWAPCQQRLGDYAVKIHIEVVKVDASAVGVCVESAGLKYPTIEQALAGSGVKRKKSRITPNVRKPR